METENLSIVVGCGSDIGHAICKTLIERGDAVIGTTRSGTLSQSFTSNLDFEILPCDSTDIQSVRALFDQLGVRRARNLIYCAGFHRLAPVSPVSSGSLDEHMAVNFQGAINCARTFISNKYSVAEFQKTVTIVASIAHRIGEAGLVGYSASKAAIVAAVRGMAVEYASRNVRVNTVSPGWVEGSRADTVMSKLSDEAFSEIRRRYPLGFGKPSDIADAVSFLSSDCARWITGIDLPVDGGRTCT